MTTLSVPRIRGAIDTEGPTLANFGGFGGRMALRDGIGAPTLRTRAVSAETAMDDFRVSQAMKKVYHTAKCVDTYEPYLTPVL